MTGYELLMDELRKMGYSEACLRAKAIDGCIKIFAGDKADLILDVKALEDQKEERLKLYYERERNLKDLRLRVDREYEKLTEKQKALDEKVDEFNREIEAVETPEAKDRIRLAHFFIENTDVTNGYERTAYIKGLGAILSGAKIEVGGVTE